MLLKTKTGSKVEPGFKSVVTGECVVVWHESR